MRALNRIVVLLSMVCLIVTANAAPQRGTRGANEGARAGAASTTSVNINTAGVEELTSLPGIGPALAKRIVEYRTQHGPFKSVDDLVAVKGLGPKMLEKIRSRLSVDANAR